MTGIKPPYLPKNSLLNPLAAKINVAIITDAWFPIIGKRPGITGGGQVHVKELTHKLSTQYPVNFTLFFPYNPHFIYRFFWSFWAIIKIFVYHQKKHFSLIHSHGFNSGFTNYLVSRLLRLPSIHTVHGSHLMDLKERSIKAYLEKLILTKTPYSAQITVSSTFLKYPNVNKHIFVIRNGVNVSKFDAVKIDKTAYPSVIWVGRNDKTKGLNVLKRAILKVRKKFPTLRAKLILNGQLSQINLIKAYKKSHIFVLPSLAEGQPITLLEAWAAKLPVIVTDVGDNKQMVVNNQNGLLIEPNHVLQLVNAIIKVLKSKTLHVKMAEAGYQLVKTHYTWSKVAEQTWLVYQLLLKNNNKTTLQSKLTQTPLMKPLI